MLKDGTVPLYAKRIAQDRDPVSVFFVGRSSIFSCSVVGEKHDMERFFSFKFSSVRIAIENAFGQLKGRFGCLKTSYGYWYQCITPSYYGLFRLTQL